jgi:hypothetical protein
MLEFNITGCFARCIILRHTFTENINSAECRTKKQREEANAISNVHSLLCFVDRASRYMRVMKPTWRTIYLASSAYSVTIPLLDSGLLLAHHQEETICVCNNLYVLYVLVDSWRAADSQLRRTTHTSYLTYLLHAAESFLWSWQFSQLTKKFPAFYGTRRFFTVLTSDRHLSLSWTNSIQSPSPTPTSWTSILILSYHLHLGLPNDTYQLSHI